MTSLEKYQAQLIEAIESLLENLDDAGENTDPETGNFYPDIAEIRKLLFKIKKETKP